MMKYIKPMLDNTEAGSKKVRLLGISISNFVDESCKIKKYEIEIPKSRTFLPPASVLSSMGLISLLSGLNFN